MEIENLEKKYKELINYINKIEDSRLREAVKKFVR